MTGSICGTLTTGWVLRIVFALSFCSAMIPTTGATMLQDSAIAGRIGHGTELRRSHNHILERAQAAQAAAASGSPSSPNVQPSSTPSSKSILSPAVIAIIVVVIVLIVAIASAAGGVWLYRRRRNRLHAATFTMQHKDTSASWPRESLSTTKGSREIDWNQLDPIDFKDDADPKWLVESASRVSIMKGARVHRVSGGSRAASRRSSIGSRKGSGLVNPSTPVSSKRNSLAPGSAFSRYSITPDVLAFPAPPSSTLHRSADAKEPMKEKRISGWPLPKQRTNLD